MPLYESGEDYLETILLLEERTGYVRSIDVANELGFSKPSISRAMSILKSNGYITIEQDGQIKLTKTGHKRAKEVYERHKVIKAFLEQTLSVNSVTAEQDACRVEHVISDESYLRLKQFMDKYKEQNQ